MSIDTLILPDLKICQPDKGFRFGMDSVVLAWFTRLASKDRLIDIGAGSGVISVLLARLKGVSQIVSVELQQEMYACLEESVRLNHLEGTITPVHSAIEEYTPKGRFDAAICNPPYHPPNTGQVSANTSEATSRFDNSLDTANMLKFCKSYVKYGGKLFFSGVAERLAPIMALCKLYNFEPKRLLLLYPGPDRAAKIFYMECLYGGGIGLQIEPPLYHEGTDNQYDEILQGKWE